MISKKKTEFTGQDQYVKSAVQPLLEEAKETGDRETEMKIQTLLNAWYFLNNKMFTNEEMYGRIAKICDLFITKEDSEEYRLDMKNMREKKPIKWLASKIKGCDF
jgi:hypothetical protein